MAIFTLFHLKNLLYLQKPELLNLLETRFWILMVNNSFCIHSIFLNFRPGKWQWYTTKLIIYQEESESNFAQIAELGF